MRVEKREKMSASRERESREGVRVENECEEIKSE